MNKIIEHDTREHLLVTGELLCMQRGLTGVGLSELLETIEIPRGSLYYHFCSKEAFGVAILERHYVAYHRRLATHFDMGARNYRDRIPAYYQETLNQFSQHGTTDDYLTVKLSAKVCDLPEGMRTAMDRDARHIIVLLAQALEEGQTSHCLSFVGELLQQVQVLYVLWPGANLQAKTSRSTAPLGNALVYVKNIITTPTV